MRSTKAAVRYARALLEIAIDQKQIDSVLGDMQFLLSANDEAPEFGMLLASPIVKTDKKIEIFEMIFGQFEESSMAFIKLITKNRREPLLVEIASAFIMLVKEHRGIVPITLISAVRLEESTKNAILEKVRGAIEGNLEVTEEIDETLIGGFMVRMGDVQIDASISSQFNNLKQRLTR